MRSEVSARRRCSLVSAVLAFLAIMTACSPSRPKIDAALADPIMPAERREAVRYVGRDTLSGTLHDLIQMKCPAPRLSEPGAPCTRYLLVHTDASTSAWPRARVKQDTVRLRESEVYVLEYSMHRSFLPYSIEGPKGDVQFHVKEVPGFIVYGITHMNPECERVTKRKYKYARCEVSELPAARFRVPASYLERFANTMRPMGAVPVTVSSDSVDVLLLMVSSSP